ncbi:hypothetical protein FSP39_015291 [Pinctada imbricata]|uniref:Glutamate--cysteine ligase n=1 Tax=Pinctada imbricata TaxID=66713 RepID=A0AA89BUT4_PINIB|nr:hypothetical protein FSP39_015291 [Pinctada imbricata]
MGLLSEGSPLSWADTQAHADHVRKHGIEQFINQYQKLKERKNDVLYWGDEVEYMLVKFDDDKRTAKLTLKAEPVLTSLQAKEKESPENHPTTWRPEYAAYMVEGTPGKPYGGLLAHFNVVEANMKLRREEITKRLGTNEVPLSLTSFPRTGCPNFTVPEHKPTPTSGASRSLFYPDEVIFPGHPRFRTLTRNIRERRKEKVAINIPLYMDEKTKAVEDLTPLGDDGESQMAAKPENIYMDCMGFGMGCSCLQVTFQACNIQEAMRLYDELTPLCPIMLALSAASPIYRGRLADIDARWSVISQSVDDRTKEERGIEPLKTNKYQIQKSRYDSTDSYLCERHQPYNDINLIYDQEIYKRLKENDISELLSLHIAHLFIRDPISLFSEKINQDDTEDVDHFENIQSTNWQTMRFKPPPPQSKIGWRVEFRPMEVQLSDFENAAYTVFIVLLTRVILTYGLSLVIPISKVDENMKTAHKKDAVQTEKFHFRKEILTDCTPDEVTQCLANTKCKECSCIDEEYTEMTIDQIINGGDEFPGLIAMINNYMSSVDIDVDTRCTIQQYLNLISKRASGEIPTTAQWMRNFVRTHKDYKQDSVVSESINYDLLKKCVEKTGCCLNDFSKTSDNIPTALSKAEGYLNKKNPPSYKNVTPVYEQNGDDAV